MLGGFDQFSGSDSDEHDDVSTRDNGHRSASPVMTPAEGHTHTSGEGIGGSDSELAPPDEIRDDPLPTQGPISGGNAERAPREDDVKMSAEDAESIRTAMAGFHLPAPEWASQLDNATLLEHVGSVLEQHAAHAAH
mmetsp:Transcript_17875/g.28513  ORF Transcript_17875/g.28513 Transcript_17875/m.28513 type:complete len:136 (-) Transcript_17875:456-863(-)